MKNFTLTAIALGAIATGVGLGVGGVLHYLKTGEILISLLLGGFLLIAIPGAILLVRELRRGKEKKEKQ